MDITPQVINEVEFRGAVRGYDRDEVDDFLERMAVAVGQLRERVQSAEQRAAAAERRMAEAVDVPSDPRSVSVSGPVPEAETISRALIAAQRTADALVQEARDEAARLTATSQEQSRDALAGAQDQARRLVAEAESEAQHAHAEARSRVIAEIGELEATREALRADVSLLEAHFEEQRLRLRSSIDELHRLLDDPGRLRLTPVPELSGALTTPAPLGAPVADAVFDAARFDEELQAAPPPVVATPEPEVVPGSLRDEREDLVTDAPMAAAAAAAPAGDDPAAAGFRIDDPDTSDDAYLAELRRAMIEDDDEFGPEAANLFGPESDLDADAHEGRTRFGRRR